MVSFTTLIYYPWEASAGWAPERVWATYRGEKSYPYWDSNCDPSAIQPVACRYTGYAIPPQAAAHNCEALHT